MAQQKSVLRRLELPLTVLLLGALALVIWRPWVRNNDFIFSQVPETNLPPRTDAGKANVPSNTDGKAEKDAVKDGEKDGKTKDGFNGKPSFPPDFGSFHTTVKPEDWATTDSAGRLTGSHSFVGRQTGSPTTCMVSGHTLDTSGPVPGCRLEVTLYELPETGPQRTMSYSTGYSDKNGVYLLALMVKTPPDGRAFITIVAHHEGYTPSVSEGFEPREGNIATHIAMTKPATVTGRVVDDLGAPVPDAKVVLHMRKTRRPDYPEKLVETNLIMPHEIAADDKGAFELSLPEDEYTAVAAKPGFAFEGQGVAVKARGGQSTALAEDIVMRGVPQLRLRLSDADKWTNLSVVEARFFDARGKAVGKHLLQAGAKGEFSGNLGSIPPGEFKLELWEFRGALMTTLSKVSVKAREMTDLGDIVIEPK